MSVHLPRPSLFGQPAAQLAQLLQRRVIWLEVRDDGLDHVDLGILGTRATALAMSSVFPVCGKYTTAALLM